MKVYPTEYEAVCVQVGQSTPCCSNAIARSSAEYVPKTVKPPQSVLRFVTWYVPSPASVHSLTALPQRPVSPGIGPSQRPTRSAAPAPAAGASSVDGVGLATPSAAATVVVVDARAATVVVLVVPAARLPPPPQAATASVSSATSDPVRCVIDL